jgi:hypothetical protein
MKKKRLSRRGRRGRKLGGDERDGEGQGVKTRGIKEGWRLFPLYNFFCLSGRACIIYIGCETYGSRAMKTRAAFLCLDRTDV